MSREIMQQALDALKYHTEHTYPFHLTNVAIEALQKALAQPEQEPFKPDWVSYRQGVVDGAAQPEQEPTLFYGRAVYFADPQTGEVKPPRKEWVGLTDAHISLMTSTHKSLTDLCRAIEAKLKEKNT